MKKLCVFLILCLLVLIVPSLTPRGSVIAHGGIGGQVHNPHVARIPLNVGLDPMGLLGVPMYQDGGYWQLAEKSALVGDSPLFAFGYGEVPVEIESVFMEEGVSGTFSGDNPGGTITYAITGVQSDGPPTDKIDGWRTDAYGDLVGFASRSYSGYVVGDSITLSYGLSGEKFCKDLSFTSGDEHIFIGCYSWDDSAPSGSITFAAPPEGKSVTFSLKLWRNSDIGRTDIIVSGTFSRQRPAVEIIPVPVTEPDPPALPPIDPTSPPRAEVVLPPVPTPSQTDSDGLWTVVIGGMAIMGVAAAGIAAIGVAGAAAVLVAKAKRRELDNNLDQLAEDEIVGYILELSTNEVVLMENKPQTVRVTCWKVRASGAYERAPEAAMILQTPPPLSNITVSPLSGQGSMDVQFNLLGESNAETHQVVITASGGGESTSAVVTINLIPALEITLTTHDGNTHLEIGEEGLWACAQIISDSASPSNKPDLRTPNIRFRLEGPNAGWIEMGQPVYRDEWQWVYVTARPPQPGAQLERGNPVLIAEYQEEQNKIHVQAQMILELQTEYQLRVKLYDAKSAEIEYHRGQATWQAPDVLVYWVNPSLGDTPVEPDFDYGFDDPPLRIDPPCLSLDIFIEHAPHQYRMQFQVAQDLEQYFGEDLVEQNGMVKIMVEAIDDEQEKHFAEHDFQVRPVAIPLIYFWHESPSEKFEGREHYGIQLNEGELISDGEDSLGVSAFLVRVDRMADFQQAYEHPLALSQPPGVELGGVNCSQYRLHEEPANENPHRYAGRVKTDQEEPVFYLSQEHELSVRVNLALDLQRYPNYFYNQHPSLMRAGVKPIEVYLKLWVHPGAVVGTSDAGGYLYLPSKKAALVGKELTLDIQSSGGASLSTRQAARTTDENGLARWRLDYHGLTWRNYDKVVFTIRCGLPSSNGGFVGTQAKIDIGYNVHKTLSDLHAQRKNKTPPNNLDLDNPEWESGSGFRAFLGDWLFPDFLSGPCVNFVGFFTGKEHYVCSELRDRVIEWLQHRRYASYNSKYEGFNEEKHMSMNGIEYGNYGIWFLGPVDHNFAGIFLSNKNADPLDDPRFPDPWWEQNWSSEKVKYPNGLYTKAQEHALQASTLAIKGVLAFLVTAFIGWKLGPAMVASLKPKLKYIFTGMALTNSLVGVYHKEEVTRCNQNLERARRSCLGEPFNRVEPIIRW